MLRSLFTKFMAGVGKARRVANRLKKKIELVQYSENFTNEAARNSLSDEQYVEESVRTLLRTYVPMDPVVPNEDETGIS